MGNNYEELTRLMAEADAFMQSHRLAPKIIYSVNLVLEEILTNIVKYAFDADCIPEVQLVLTVKDRHVEVRCEDSGREFDPLSVPPPELQDSIQECNEGGLGIHLVRRTVKSIEYCRNNNKNILTMTI
jgi:anti-sigma regulatory factor (Ser/Thr protein kinase)